MSHITGHRCDTCGAVDPTHPDDGPPTGWYLLALMDSPGCWEVQRDFCGVSCLEKWVSGDTSPAPTATPTEPDDLVIGSEEWFERRERLWAKDAEELRVALYEYEEQHPAGAPCLDRAMNEARKSLATYREVKDAGE